VVRIISLLEKEYGLPVIKKRGDLLDVLIETVLSQNTNDRNRDRAFERLKSRFPDWEDVLKASPARLISAIRPAGLAKQRTKTIQGILQWIKEECGRLSLIRLQKKSSREVEEILQNIKGIGPKTIHCLLLFGMGREAFPVDTHILRVGKRVGFISGKIDAREAHRWMAPLIPAGKARSLHLNLIRFGREICSARSPKCRLCFLVKECLNVSGVL
jgi:endonuclease III